MKGLRRKYDGSTKSVWSRCRSFNSWTGAIANTSERGVVIYNGDRSAQDITSVTEAGNAVDI